MMRHTWIVFLDRDDDYHPIAIFSSNEMRMVKASEELRDKIGKLADACGYGHSSMYAHVVRSNEVNTEGLPLFKVFNEV